MEAAWLYCLSCLWWSVDEVSVLPRMRTQGVTWSCPHHLCVHMTFACFYKLGKTMRLNVMPSCGYLASAAELALRSRSLAKSKDTRVAFLTFFVVRDAIRRGRTHAVVECENNTFETSACSDNPEMGL